MAEDYIELEDSLDDIEPVNQGTELYEHFRVVVDKGQTPVRIDKYLFERIVNASRNRIQAAADAGFVMANGKPVKSSYKVKPQDVLTVMMDRPRYENDIIPEDIPLDIVYEDNDLLVVNKPRGMVVHPAAGHTSGTLVNALMAHCGDSLSGINGVLRPGIVHRIDKDTSGLLIVAKNDDLSAGKHHPQVVPHARHRRRFQRAQRQHFVVALGAQTREIEVVVVAAAQRDHIAIIPAVMPEACPNLHLGRILRAPGRKREFRIFQLHTGSSHPAVGHGQHAILHTELATIIGLPLAVFQAIRLKGGGKRLTHSRFSPYF